MSKRIKSRESKKEINSCEEMQRQHLLRDALLSKYVIPAEPDEVPQDGLP